MPSPHLRLILNGFAEKLSKIFKKVIADQLISEDSRFVAGLEVMSPHNSLDIMTKRSRPLGHTAHIKGEDEEETLQAIKRQRGGAASASARVLTRQQALRQQGVKPSNTRHKLKAGNNEETPRSQRRQAESPRPNVNPVTTPRSGNKQETICQG